jgi:hypothetical protein
MNVCLEGKGGPGRAGLEELNACLAQQSTKVEKLGNCFF